MEAEWTEASQASPLIPRLSQTLGQTTAPRHASLLLLQRILGRVSGTDPDIYGAMAL